MNACFHVHSENSLKECPLFIKDILKKAKEIGYEAVVLTDNANMTGIAEFVKTSKEYGIKPILAVEINILLEDNKIATLVLIAKDYIGYVALCKIVSEENKTIINDKPVLDSSFLRDFFEKEERFKGHVIATSSDANGVIAINTLKNIADNRTIEEIKSALSEIDETNEDIEKIDKKLEKANAELEALKIEKKEVEKNTKKNFSVKEERIKKLTDANEKAEAIRILEQEKEESLKADESLEKIKGKISRKRKRILQLNNDKKKIQDILNNKADMLSQINDIQNNRKTDDELYEIALSSLKKYKEIFGEDFYLEFMFHGLEEEAISMPILERLAYETDTKTIISNDVHILNGEIDDIARWFAIKSLQDNKWIEQTEEAFEYRMKTREELENFLFGFLSEEIIEQSFSNMEKIANDCSFEWIDEKHYPKYENKDNKTTEETLSEEAKKRIKTLFKKGEWTQEYEDRLNYELSVINKTGYADYTMIISEILDEGRKGNHDGKIGSYIGPGRGSGAGSLVNYLMGITHIDPIKYDLIFERYLNIERISPPDIDSDIATSVRASLVKYITQRYSKLAGKIGVCTISTKQRLTAKAAVRAAGRIVSSKYYDNAARLYSVADKISKEIPTELHMTLDKCIDDLESKFTDDTEKEIIYYARLIENILSGYGTHAAGMIISDNGDVTEYAPVMNMGTTQEPVWNIQYDKEESEGIGMLKLDALGLTTLDVISKTMQRVLATRGKTIDIDNIKFEKQVFQAIYQKGDTNGVFQCESAGMKKMWLQLKPDCIDDIIAGVALYRPGPMDFIPAYIKGKHNPRTIKYITPQLKPILEKTYGQIVYQEQVMRIVRDLAGFSMGRSDLVRRAMSKKKESIMNDERKNFIYGNEKENIKGCIHNGISEEAANQIYDMMIDFAKYAFNKSHAAAYAIVSYQSAWLKFHYPKEFLIEVMNLEKPENLPVFIDECVRKKYAVKCPDINKSSVEFNEVDGDILFGLGNVKGVKNNASKIIQNRGRGYENFLDFLERSEANKSTIKALISAGAFDNFNHTRTGLLVCYEELLAKTQKKKELLSRIQIKQEKIDNQTYKTETEKKRLLKSIDSDTQQCNKICEELKNYYIPYITDKKEDILEMEKQYLFTYVSAHPLDEYLPILTDVTNLADIEEGNVKVAGVISDLRILRTKKTNKDMAVFYLCDKTDKKKVLCFPSIYEKYSTILREDNILKVYGDYKKEQNGEECNIIPAFISEIISKEKQIIFSVKNKEEWEDDILPKIKKHLISNGSEILLYTEDDGILTPTGLYLPPKSELEDVQFSFVRSFIKNTGKGAFTI